MHGEPVCRADHVQTARATVLDEDGPAPIATGRMTPRPAFADLTPVSRASWRWHIETLWRACYD